MSEIERAAELQRTTPQSPAGLSVIMAREAPRAVILRKGPSDWTRAILWHTDDDTFEYGQWFHGTIYPQVCSLSPDGKLFAYFAAKFQLKHRVRSGEERGLIYEWTAISKPPYFTALALWPHIDRSYLGGGYFADDGRLVLHGRGYLPQPAEGSLPPNLIVATDFESQDFDVLKALDGWNLTQRGVWQKGRCAITREWTKRHPRGNPALVRSTEDRRTYSYTVSDSAGHALFQLAGVRSADWDHRGRLVYADNGRLWACDISGAVSSPTELADFSDQHFEEVIAPAWAKEW